MNNLPDNYSMTDHSNPANWNDPKARYEVTCPKLRYYNMSNLVAEFNDESEALAYVGNVDTYKGEELTVTRIDEATGDEAVVMSAEWDDVVQRYLEGYE